MNLTFPVRISSVSFLVVIAPPQQSAASFLLIGADGLGKSAQDNESTPSAVGEICCAQAFAALLACCACLSRFMYSARVLCSESALNSSASAPATA